MKTFFYFFILFCLTTSSFQAASFRKEKKRVVGNIFCRINSDSIRRWNSATDTFRYAQLLECPTSATHAMVEALNKYQRYIYHLDR